MGRNPLAAPRWGEGRFLRGTRRSADMQPDTQRAGLSYPRRPLELNENSTHTGDLRPMSKNIARTLTLSVGSVGLIGGAALAMAGVANATPTPPGVSAGLAGPPRSRARADGAAGLPRRINHRPPPARGGAPVVCGRIQWGLYPTLSGSGPRRPASPLFSDV